MKLIKNIPYADAEEYWQSLDLYLPDCNTFPTFLYFHGGGLECGSKEDQNFFEALAQRGICVVSANYRLYPNAKFSEFIEDAAAAVAWVSRHIDDYGDCKGIFVGGSSAGGYLTQMLCFDNRYLAKHGVDADSLGGYFMDAGQPTSHFNVLREKGIDTRRVIVDETAPLFFVDGKRSYSPIKILVSENDMENRLEQTMLLVSTLKHFRHDMTKVDFEIVPNSGHCEYIHKPVFVDMISNFINKNTR